MKPKRYIAVGDHLPGPDGTPVYMEPLAVCRAYGVDPHEAILVDRRHHTYRHIMRKYPDLPVLHPREDGHYSLVDLD